MDELIKMVAQKCNIPEPVARTAVELVVNWLKTRLPAPVAGQLDAVLSGKEIAAPKGLGGLLSGILGKK